MYILDLFFFLYISPNSPYPESIRDKENLAHVKKK